MNPPLFQQQFSVTFKAPVWQIRPDPQEKILAVQTRDGDRLQTEFTVVNAETGALILADFRASENWWIGLEETSQGILFLHGFGDRKLGTHQGLWACSIENGQIIWQNEEVVFYGLAAGNNLVVQYKGNNAGQFALLNSGNGNIVKDRVSAPEAQAAVSSFAQAGKAGLRYPDHYPEGSEYFRVVSEFILSATNAITVKAIDYLETELFFAVGYYEEGVEDTFKNTVGVFSSQDGSCLGEIVISAEGTGLALDSFFLMSELLITIKEKNTLLGFCIK